MQALYQTIALAYVLQRHREPGIYQVSVPRRGGLTLAKAERLDVNDPNTRWITLHPNGKHAEDYVRVLIRVNPDGTGRVLSGSGSLRGLKLNKLKTPEEWKAGSRERAKARREKKKAEREADEKRAAEDPDFASELEQRREAEANHEQEKEKLADKVLAGRVEQLKAAKELGLAGWRDIDEDLLTAPDSLKEEKLARALKAVSAVLPEANEAAALAGGAGLSVGHLKRRLMGGFRRLEKSLINEMAENHELREQVLGGDLDAAEALPTHPKGGKGFKSTLKQDAAESGMSEAQIRAQNERLSQERIAAIEETDPARAQKVREGRATMRSMHRVASALKEMGDRPPELEADLSPEQARERAERIRGFLQASHKVKALERQLRDFDQDTADVADAIQQREPTAFDVDVSTDEAFVKDLRETLQQAKDTKITSQFFDTVSTPQAGLSEGEQKRALLGRVNHGAYSHLNAALLTSLGSSNLDRHALDVLGLEAASKLVAWRLAKDLAPEDLRAVRDGLARYHDETSVAGMAQAMEEAESAKALALELDLPKVRDAASLAAAKELNAERRHHLETAMRTLGTTLGQVEAGAALNLALMHRPRDGLSIDYPGTSDPQAVLTGLAALGLAEGEDYRAEKDVETGALKVNLFESALERLTQGESAQELATRATLEAIREGHHDEADYLPAGFARYSKNMHNDPEYAPLLSTPPDFGSDVKAGLRQFVAERLADGYKASDILREAGAIDFVLDHVPEGRRDAYLAALKELFPVEGEDGKLRNVDLDKEIQQRLEQLVGRFMADKHPGEADFHNQRVDVDDRDIRRSAFLAISEDPRTSAAFKKKGELTADEQAAIRSYFFTEIAGADESGRDLKAYEAGLKDLGPEPEKFGADLFGSQSVTPAWSEWNAARQELAEQHAGPTLWDEFVTGMRGRDKAYEAVQEHMRGRFGARFAKYAANSGTRLKLGTAALSHAERFGVASDKDARAELLAREQSQMAGLRERKAGKFAAEGEGSVIEKLREKLKQDAAFGQMETALFDMGGKAYELNRPALKNPFEERYSLGRRLEAQLGSILPYVRGSLEPGSKGVRMIPELTMGAGTKYIKQQRAIRFAKAAKKSLLAMGMGCVKGTTSLTDAITGETRTFAEWKASGARPNVLAYDQARCAFRVIRASIPFVKGYEVMYEVVTATGNRIEVAAGHKFLTAIGWRRLSDLSKGDAIFAVSSATRSAVNAPYSTRTEQGFRGDYRPACRSYDEQPRPDRASGPALVPSPSDARRHSLDDSSRDVPACIASHNLGRNKPDLPSSCSDGRREGMMRARWARGSAFGVIARSLKHALKSLQRFEHRSSPAHAIPSVVQPIDSWARTDYFEEEALASSGDSPQLSESHGAAAQFRRRSTPADTARGPVGSQLSDSHRNPYWDEIVEIIPLAASYVYDITVPVLHNYVAHGLIHHNSGKTGVQIGTFTELNKDQQASKGLFVAPSVVKKQFGEEMARFTEPGRYRWHAKDATFEDRLKAYQDPDTHMIVVTHQAFRDDMLRMMAAHQGVADHEAMQQHFEGARPEKRRAMLREALEHHQASAVLDYLAMDEAHDALSRAGKPDSFLQMVTDAAMAEAKHVVAATGTPVKNDASEAFSWLEKLAPERWAGKREEFKRRYGVDLPSAQEAFKREVSRYIYASTVASGAQRKEVWGQETSEGDKPLALTPAQQKTLDTVNTAFELARRARREGKVDLEALKALSPNSFEGLASGEEHAHAERLQDSLGTLKYAAQARAIHGGKDNAKVQRVRELARLKRESGQPGVVFARHLASVATLKEALEADGHRVAVVTGADTSEKKAQKRQMFHPDQGEPEVDVLVLSDAGAVGMNLQRGQWLVNYDIPETYKTLTQRNGRIDRIGQQNDVEIHNLVTDSQYDRDAVRRVTRKERLQNVFTDDWDRMDDSGLASYIEQARNERLYGEMPSAA